MLQTYYSTRFAGRRAILSTSTSERLPGPDSSKTPQVSIQKRRELAVQLGK